MKRHVTDFNSFSVNEMITGSVPRPDSMSKVQTWEFDMNIVNDKSRGGDEDGPTPEMTYKFIKALQDNNVLLNVIKWFGPGGGATVIQLTGRKQDIRNVFRQSMDPDAAAQFIEDLEDMEPVA